MVQFAEAHRIEQRWKASGRPYCEHPDVDKNMTLAWTLATADASAAVTRSRIQNGDLQPRGVRKKLEPQSLPH